MWEYRDAGRVLTILSVKIDICIYCGNSLLIGPSQQYEKGEKKLIVQLSICQLCGWWAVYRIHQGEFPRTAGIVESHSGTIGSLKELDLSDIEIPLNEVRQYILAKKDSMYRVHPRLFENIVGSIFKDFGWSVRVTGYSGDEGIDVILDDPAGLTIGVQVRRYKKERRIEAEQIRSLAGAMILGGHTKGVFITTSHFRSGAIETANRFSSIGQPIGLLDASRFLDALGIVQSKIFELKQDQAISYIMSKGIHLGSGIDQPYVEGEDIRQRQIAASINTPDEFTEIYL